jgi:hypothetical protein
VFIDAGVLTSNTSINFGGKSYINLVGRGIGVSILRASGTWFATTSNCNSNDSSCDFLNLSGANHVTVRALTIDAKTSDNGSNSASFTYNGVRTDDGYSLLFDSMQAMGTSFGMWEKANSSGNRIDVINSEIVSAGYGLNILTPALWHVLSSDIRAVATGVHETTGTLKPTAVNLPMTANPQHLDLWGCNILAETTYAADGDTTGIAAVLNGGEITIIGTTVHAKLSATPAGTVGVYGIHFGTSASGNVQIVGSRILYETTSGITGGYVAGLSYPDIDGQLHVGMKACNFVDAAGSGGAQRADIINAGTDNQPDFRIGTIHSSSNPQTGTETLSGGTTTVMLSPTQADKLYIVTLTSATKDTLSVTNKTTTQFTIHSSNSSSTAVVDYLVTRP